MKKKMVLRLLSLAMIASMTGTMLPSNFQIVSAEDAVVAEEWMASFKVWKREWKQSGNKTSNVCES